MPTLHSGFTYGYLLNFEPNLFDLLLAWSILKSTNLNVFGTKIPPNLQVPLSFICPHILSSFFKMCPYFFLVWGVGRADAELYNIFYCLSEHVSPPNLSIHTYKYKFVRCTIGVIFLPSSASVRLYKMFMHGKQWCLAAFHSFYKISQGHNHSTFCHHSSQIFRGVYMAVSTKLLTVFGLSYLFQIHSDLYLAWNLS